MRKLTSMVMKSTETYKKTTLKLQAILTMLNVHVLSQLISVCTIPEKMDYGQTCSLLRFI